MALRAIRKDSDPVLHKLANPVKKRGAWLDKLLIDMEETMVFERGAGLAAPQVGISKRVILALDDVHMKLYKLINPTMIAQEGEDEGFEGCLSVPDYVGKVKRAETITVEALNPSGEKVIIEAEGFFARVLQHEIDHLNGILFTDIASEVFENTPDDEDEDDEEAQVEVLV